MTARQIIEEIDLLSPEERREVQAYLLNNSPAPGVVRFADKDKAMAVADKIFTERAELFKKLAQ